MHPDAVNHLPEDVLDEAGIATTNAEFMTALAAILAPEAHRTLSPEEQDRCVRLFFDLPPK